MPKAGRTRRLGAPRYPGGQIVHACRRPKETPDEIKAVVRAWRRRHHADLAPKTPEEEAFAGYELGRLYLRRVIDERQRKAGEAWARCVARYVRTMGYPAPTPRSVCLEEGRGLSCTPETDPERLPAVRRAYADALRALSDAGATIQERRTSLAACRDVCIQDADTRAWPHHMIDGLKRGLDRLADFFRL